jgi:hypothetical protein
MKMQVVPLTDLDGGQFDSLEPSSIPAGSWQRLVNFLPYRRRINVRGGYTKVSMNAVPGGNSDLNTVCVAPALLDGSSNTYTDVWAMVAAAKSSGFYLLSALGGWVRKITNNVGGSITSDAMPWCMTMLSGLVYAVRRNGGRMKSISAADWREAGRPKPGAFVAGAATNGGSLQASKTYTITYSYYDSTLGYYGPESDPQSITTGVAEKQIPLSGLDVPATSYRADRKIIWCTVGGGVRRFRLTDIPAADTTYTITAEPTGEEYSTRHEQPPSDASWWAVWSQRSWWVRGSNLAYSLVGFYESYSALQELEFDKADGEDLVVAYPWQNRLVVAKSGKMWYLEGYDRQSWEVREWTKKAGCAAPHSMEDCEGTLVWKGVDGFYASGGDSPVNITTETVAAYLANEDKDRADLSVAEVVPELGIYVCTIPLVGGGWGAVAYNWRKRSWSVLDFPTLLPPFLVRGNDMNGKARIFAPSGSGDRVYAILEGGDDDGGEITAEAISGYPVGLVEPAELVGVRDVRLLAQSTRAPITISVYGNGETTPITSTDARLDADAGWNIVTVSSMRDLRSQVQVGIRYVGRQAGWWVSQMAWRLALTRAVRGEK